MKDEPTFTQMAIYIAVCMLIGCGAPVAALALFLQALTGRLW